MFKKICQMSQNDLKKFVAKQLEATHGTVFMEDGYVFAQGQMPVLLVAHLDTVHEHLPTQIFYDKESDSIFSPQGIGADDRCGVYMILEVIKKYNCSVLFCEDEEIGGVGAEKFTESKLAEKLEFNYAIEFDRRGSDDAVFYHCNNIEFEEFITEEFYKTAYGTFSDISVLAPYLGCAAVNLSCGYYNAHTKDEYVVMSEMQASIEAACKILERTTENDKFEYIESYKNYGNYMYDYDYFEEKERIFLIEYKKENSDLYDWEEIYAQTKAEAIGKFCMAHPSIPYANIDIYEC